MNIITTEFEKSSVYWQIKWNELKSKLKYQWEYLTEEDLKCISRNRNLMTEKLQQRYGFTQNQANKAVRNFFKYPYHKLQAE